MTAPTRKRREIPQNSKFDAEVIAIVNETRRGRTNNGGEVTLTPSSATTVLNDQLITKNSVILFSPRTANAKAEGIPYYDDPTAGSVVLRHANNAQVDRRYHYTVNC